jgi:hypothetical protein
MSPVGLAFVLMAILGAVVCASRRSLLQGLTPISVFLAFWFLFNYLGMMLVVLDPELVINYWPGFDFSYFGPEQALRMLWATHVGLLCIVLGALFSIKVLGRGKLARRQPYPPVVMNMPLALSLLAPLSIWAGVRLYVDYGGNIPIFVLFRAGFAEAYWYRLSEVFVSQLWIYLSWNVIPFLSAYVVLYALAHRTQVRWCILGLFAFANGSFFLLSLLHKRGYAIWLVGLGLAVYMMSEGPSPRMLWVRIRKVVLWGLGVYLMLSLLFVLFSSASDGGFRFAWAAETAFMELVFRGTLSAMFYFSLVPEFVPFHEFENIGIFRRLMGLEVGASDTQIIFGYVMQTTSDQGSISSHLITDFYGAYGYSSLVIGALLSGVLLGLMTTTFKMMPNVPHYAVLKAGMLLFSINLCSATLFQSLVGYGLILYVLTWLLLHTFSRKRLPVMRPSPQGIQLNQIPIYSK